MTELTITPKIAKKCASIVGRIASGEHVSVTVVGAASLKTPTLQMRVIAGPTVIAIFPVPVEDGQTPAEWTVSGNDLVCELNLNTVQALAICRAPETYCLFSFEEVGDKNASPSERCPQLYFVAPHPVLCWPKKRPSDTPFDFDDYPSTFKTWQWQISNIAASVTKDGRTATILIVDKNGVQTVATVSDGVGVPAGGARGQVLVKKSSADFDTEWKDGGGGGGGSVDWNDVENKPTAFPPEAHSQGWGTITGKPETFAPSAHKNSHKTGGSDPITPADIGALPADGRAESAVGLLNPYSDLGLYGGTDSGRWEVTKGIATLGYLAMLSDIPALAAPSTGSTAQGKAADAKATADFINSSINAMAAFFLAKNDGTSFSSAAELRSCTEFLRNGQQNQTPTQNDYTIVSSDEDHPVFTAGVQSVYSQWTTTAQYVGYWVDYNGVKTEVTNANKDSLGIEAGTTVPYSRTLPTSRYIYQGEWSASGGDGWMYQYSFNLSGFTAAQLAALNSGSTAELIAWLLAFKGTDTATTLQSLLTSLGGKVDKVAGKGLVELTDAAGYDDIAAMSAYALKAENASRIVNASIPGNQVGFYEGRAALLDLDSILGIFAYLDELPYAKSSTVGTRKVMTIAATGPSSVNLPAIPNTDEILNCDIVVNGKAATTDFSLEIYSANSASHPVHYPEGKGITCKKASVTMVSCVGINGLGWLVVGCTNLTVPTPNTNA